MPESDVADLLAGWARRIAAGDGQTPQGLQRDLGVDGTLVASFGDMALEPAPAGFRQVHLRGGVPSMATVEVWPVEGAITLGLLDERLGPREELPRVHWDSPRTVAYDVSSDQPPGRCTVFARTSETPAPAAAVTSVLLRTEPK